MSKKDNDILDRLKKEADADLEHYCATQSFLDCVGIDNIQLEATGLDDIWFCMDGYKIKCDVDEKNWMIRLSIENFISIKAKDEEEKVKIYRTINNFCFSYDAKLYYELMNDDTFIISAMIKFPIEYKGRGYICHQVLCLTLLPNTFDKYLHEHYDEIEDSDICNKDFDVIQSEVVPHREEIIKVLEDMGCSPEIAEDEASFVYFSYQHEEFGLSIETVTGNKLVFYNNGWYSCDMADIDKLSEIRRVVNELNSNFCWNLSYRRDMDKKKYYVFSNAGMDCPSADLLRLKVEEIANDFFEVRNKFIRKLTLFDYIKEQDE